MQAEVELRSTANDGVAPGGEGDGDGSRICTRGRFFLRGALTTTISSSLDDSLCTTIVRFFFLVGALSRRSAAAFGVWRGAFGAGNGSQCDSLEARHFDNSASSSALACSRCMRLSSAFRFLVSTAFGRAAARRSRRTCFCSSLRLRFLRPTVACSIGWADSTVSFWKMPSVSVMCGL